MIRWAFYVLALHLVMPLTDAMGFCDQDTDVSSECLDTLKDAVNDVVTADDDLEKSETVGGAVGECIQCASESFADSMRNLTGN